MLRHSTRRVFQQLNSQQTFGTRKCLHRSMCHQQHRFLSLCTENVNALLSSRNCNSKVWQKLSCMTYVQSRNNSTETPQTNTKPVFLLAENYKSRTAIISQYGTYSYTDLLYYTAGFAKDIVDSIKRTNPNLDVNNNLYLQNKRVVILCDNDLSYVVATWAVWLLGGVSVPQSKSYPTKELEYFVEDAGASLMITTETFRSLLEPVSEKLEVQLHVMTRDDYGGDYEARANVWEVDRGLDLGIALQDCLHNDGFRHKDSMIVYTSGTTGKPKGVVHTFGSLDAQIRGMVEMWGWTKDDTVLHVLPLHHVHGIVNVLLTPLYCGATCVMIDKFDPIEVWKSLLKEDSCVNLFMAVPTIYVKLLEEYDKQMTMTEPTIPGIKDAKEILLKKIRLMVSGSAALPEPIMRRWAEVTGHTLLERYGMTEVGMALTNPLHGPRVPGSVGLPFPGVKVCIVSYHDNHTGYDIITEADSKVATQTPGREEESGELLVKGDNLFREYWKKPQATIETFTEDGWFKTGDTAVYKDNTFRIVGRTSVDIIKSGAFKISALDIERHLLDHPSIQEVAVLGVPDDTWGQVVAAVVAVKNSEDSITLQGLKDWSRDHMATYQIPRILKIVGSIPRNSMGKVNKKQLLKDMFLEYLAEK